jgi:membrane-associated phospholipid phosphatase
MKQEGAIRTQYVPTAHTETLSQTGLRFLPEALLVGVGYLIYSQVRGLAADRTGDALDTALWIVDLERNLGLFEELALQQLVLGTDWLIEPFNLVYFYGMFPLIVPTALWLFWRHPPTYTLLRNAFLISGAIAVCFYLLTPTMPPRLLPGFGFVDTALGHPLVPNYSSIPGVNHYAALPSMHVGWNFLVTVGLAGTLGRKWLRVTVLAIPLTMFLATVVTGNHYFFDGVAGLLVASTGIGFALLLERKFSSAPGRSLPQLRANSQTPFGPSPEQG